MPEAYVSPGKNLLGSNCSMASTSNSREMRNKAEKHRRDRLNSYIKELAKLVPSVARSTKRLDKTSILRLTATHLRLYQNRRNDLLIGSLRKCAYFERWRGHFNQVSLSYNPNQSAFVRRNGTPQMQLPPHVDQFLLEQLLCDQMAGFLLIVSPSGKIIFISPTVETLLGHLQTDLMGQSLFTVTAPEDHEKLRNCLDCERENEQGWRKYFSVKIRRAGPKSESPQYESVRIMGVHRNLTSAECSSSSEVSSSTMSPSASTSSLQTSINTDILVFFVKLYRPQPLADRLIAASKNEYVTRHLIDGRIIGCDQRVSLIAGYMIEEIQGHSAFHYMHKDDVRFVMIALRQMYDKGENRGNSCYRLKSRNGQFIYLRTFGFLEIDDQGIVESFVCVNVQVEEDEGLHHMMTMKRRYSAMFSSSLASLPSEENCEEPATINAYSPQPVVGKIDRTEDPETLEVAINELMQNLPSPGSEETAQQAEAQSPCPVNSLTPEVAKPPSGKGVTTCSTASKHPHLRIKSSGKRASSSTSPDHVKRQRLSSVDSDSSQLSPPANPSASPYMPLSNMPNLEEQYSTAPSEVARHQHNHHQGA